MSVAALHSVDVTSSVALHFAREFRRLLVAVIAALIGAGSCNFDVVS